jgi:RNA-directed DNA polymerase
MDDIIKTQQSFAKKAQLHPEHQFGDVYHLICREDWIRVALERVLSNKGSRTAGIDGVTRARFESEAYTSKFIAELRSDLQSVTFQPQPARRVYIPKPNGQKGQLRPLGILTVRDRVVQMLLKMLMEPIWESDFLDCSSGFRPGRRTMDCIAMCYRLINNQLKYFWVVEGDIKGCFDQAS